MEQKTMILKQKIKQYLRQAFRELYNETLESIPINYSAVREHGDYATPIAIAFAKQRGIVPQEVAQKIADHLKSYPEFEKVEMAGAGFINFFLSNSVIDQMIMESACQADYGRNQALKGRNILLEYVSANPTGPLHIGHGRWAALGDSMARILRYCGAQVVTEFYINDTGNQVRLLRESVEAVKHHQPVPENGYHGAYIQEIATMEGDPIQNIIEIQKNTLHKFRVEFDKWYSENELHQTGKVKDTIELLEQKGLIYKKDGAKWFRTSDFGDDKDRVVVKSDGQFTYFAVDIAYHRTKIERGFQELINVFGADHHGYLKRLGVAIQAFSKEVDYRLIIGQLVHLYRNGEPVRMSKRTGDMITLDEVIQEIGVDATRYYLIINKADSHLDFDLEVAKRQSEENRVYYIQYASARVAGILRNAMQQVGWKGANQTNVKRIIDSEEARKVAIEIIKFPEIIIDIAENLEPHRMPSYLENLSAEFHRFYHKHRVISQDIETTKQRLVLVEAMRNVLRIGLDLIGVNAPERM